jgi:hypothetical protein
MVCVHSCAPLTRTLRNLKFDCTMYELVEQSLIVASCCVDGGKSASSFSSVAVPNSLCSLSNMRGTGISLTV